MKYQFDSDPLKAWFKKEKRDLPWRQTQDPYAIWISEIMLQQTQVSVVVPYFLHWMEKFPTPFHLATAPLDEVIKAWEGLGYYSRARHLHEAAKVLVEQFEGKLPAEEDKLKNIKGLGPYTVGAILSFAFHQKKAALDGNVMRVLTRYFNIEDDIAKPSTVKRLREIAQEILPDEEPWIVNEAWIELGATICQRKAKCPLCPLKSSCMAYREHNVDQLPFKSKKTKIERLYRTVAVIQCEDTYLVKRGEKGAIMSDLYEFPYFDVPQEETSPEKLESQLQVTYGLQLTQKAILPEEKHGFTRYQVQLYPVLFTCTHRKNVEGGNWLSVDSLQKLAFSSGHRRIFQQILQHYV